MPRAENLKDAYNNLYLEPLKGEKEFREFYVERPGTNSPMEDLRDRIELSNRKEKYLFLGFRGSGKSTELNRLEISLDKDRFLVVNYSIRDDLNLSDFDLRDFFVSMSLKIYNIAGQNGIQLHSDIELDFRNFTNRITNSTKEDVAGMNLAGLSWSQIIINKINQDTKTREYVRRELDDKISELIQRLNWLIIDVEEKTGKKLVIIVDDLDKLARTSVSDNFFYGNYQMLLQPNCHVVYTFPMSLVYHFHYEKIRHEFSGSEILLAIPTKDRTGKTIEENTEFYRELITKRINPTLLDEKALDLAINSTGMHSELIAVLRDSTIEAFRTHKIQISEDDVESSLYKLRSTYDRVFTETHKKKLLDISQTNDARDNNYDSVIARELFLSNSVIEYQDEEGRWSVINPILRPLVGQWKRAQ